MMTETPWRVCAREFRVLAGHWRVRGRRRRYEVLIGRMWCGCQDARAVFRSCQGRASGVRETVWV